ncbi:zinc finger protein 596-like protein [Dinothrombium tinctorium]|uniref:Zinc finger protein 596-like protein n=1 Tax=Dinothrombium tinctorium TaxID=1965070 RepID=A0A3S3R372_9ACAR|nr:zinc finger protein 596-like protein [Dinothrombium tinctorium]
MALLINAINTGTAIEVNDSNAINFRNTVKMFKMEAKETEKNDGFVQFVIVPKLLNDETSKEPKQIEAISDELQIDFDSTSFSNAFDNGRDYGCGDSNKSKVCPHCNITCKSWQGMRRHSGHYHGFNTKYKAKETIKCLCGLFFSKNAKHLFRNHRKTCLSYIAKAFTCEICKTPFHEIPSLNNHKYTVHGIIIEPNSCICGEVFRNRYQLRKHFIQCKDYKAKASHRSVEIELISKGLKQPNKKQVTEQKDQKIVVCKCGQIFSKHSRSLYREHRKICAEFLKQAKICGICQSPFEDVISLSIHQTTVHSIDKSAKKCSCEISFKNLNQLRKHQIECVSYKNTAISYDFIN